MSLSIVILIGIICIFLGFIFGFFIATTMAVDSLRAWKEVAKEWEDRTREAWDELDKYHKRGLNG